MKKLLLELLQKICCCHRWKDYAKVTEKSHPDDGNIILGYNYTVVCIKCGKFKTIKL